MRLKSTLFCFTFLLCMQASWAQRQITGTVTDENGEPLIGANIVVEGTTTGTATDIDGTYMLDVSEDASALTASYTGYRTITKVLDASNTVDFQLELDIAGLDEVVVIGYGTRKKRDITGSISQITSKDISKSVSLSPEFALQGRATGIQIQQASGDPNQRPVIRIRGIGTLGFADPLIVIDGVPITEFGAGAAATVSSAAASDLRGTQNILNLINPQDIESISVLKDAAATAIYGLRASNGVILIETKRGRAGKPQFSFTTEYGVRNLRADYDVLEIPDYVDLLTEQYNNAGEALPAWLDPADPGYLGNSTNTDNFQEAMTNDNASLQNYNFSVRGGNQRSAFYFSAGYANQEGVLRFNDFERYNATLNSDFQITDWLKVGQNYRFAFTEGNDTRSGNLRAYFNVPAWQPVYDPSDPLGFAPVKDEAGNLLWSEETESNHLAVSNTDFRIYNLLRNLGSAYVQVNPIEGLTLKGTLGLDWYYNRRRTLSGKERARFHITDNAPNGTSYGERHVRNWNILTEFLANYAATLGERHNFDLLFNYSYQKYGFEGISGSADGIRFDDIEIVTTTPAALGAESRAESFVEKRKLAGLLGRFSYNYASKYYIDFTYRRDGSSVFGPGYRFGNFYGVSGAWRVSEEPFLANLGIFDDLKIRGGWGETGNQETQPFGYTASISLGARYPLGSDDILAIGSFPSNFPVEDLSWEVNTSTNIGLDAALLDYRLTVTFDWYDRLTKGILRPLSLPATVGTVSNPVINLAEVSNKGIELQLNWNDRIGEFSYNVGGNLTTVKNRVEKLFEDPAENDRVLNGSPYAIQVGQPIDFIYGYQASGIFQSESEVTQWKEQFSDPGRDDALSPGDFRFKDLFGNPVNEGEFRNPEPDGVINDFDRIYLGSSIPGFYYGITVGAGWKGFDVSFFFQGVGDIQKVNQIRQAGEHMTSRGLNQLTTTLDRWTPSNPSNTMPRALLNDQVGNNRFSSRWVEDADYLRFQNFQFGYALPSSVLQRISFENLRVYVSGTNMALMTSYSGLDPEVNLSNEPDFNPPPVVWLLGLNAMF